MERAMFTVPGEIHISRKTWEITGVDYIQVSAECLANFGDRLRRALETVEDVNRVRGIRTDNEREGENHGKDGVSD